MSYNPIEITWIIDEHGCWICTSHKRDTYGYPRSKIDGKSTHISRIFYEKYKGPIPPGICVCHTCDERMCINPEHLWLGTIAENMYDRTRKKRTACGEKQWRSRFKEKDILKIRELNFSFEKIAREFNTTYQRIWEIRNRKTWKHVA